MFKVWMLYVVILNHGVRSVSYDGFRLPTSVQPENYLLKIKTEINGVEDSTFSGTVTITVKAIEATENITLHAKDLTIDVNTIIVTDIGAGSKIEVVQDSSGPIPEHDYIVIGLSSPTVADGKYTIEIPFSGVLSNSSQGYYVSKYINTDTNETSFFTATNFIPNIARQAFPCFDEPQFVSTFEIILEHHKKYQAVSNMPIKKDSTTTEGEWVTDHFEISPTMPTFSVGYSINEFKFVKVSLESNSRFEIRVYAPSHLIGYVENPRRFIPQLFELYRNFFNFSCKLRKLDIISVPDLAESSSPGLGIAFALDSLLLVDPTVTSSSKTSEKIMIWLLCEVIIPQWTQLRTIKWWDDYWLPLAINYYAVLIALRDTFYGEKGFQQDISGDLVESTKNDVNSEMSPLYQTVTIPELTALQPQHAYSKGLILLLMIEKTIGHEKLKEVFSKFYQANPNPFDHDEFWNFIGTEVGDSVNFPDGISFETFMNSWTLQAGLPLLTITRDYENKKATINQQRFVLNSKDPPGNCYVVPLSYTTGADINFNDTTPKDWLECDGNKTTDKTIDIQAEATDWVIFNVQSAAYCMIKYDTKNYKLLSEVLTGPNFAIIDTSNRARLIQDSLTLSWLGKLEYYPTLQILEYLKQETDSAILVSLEKSLLSLDHVLSPGPSAAYEQYQKYIRDLFAPILKNMGGYDIVNGTLPDIVTVKTFLIISLCNYDAKECVTKAKDYFTSWESQTDVKENPIPPALRAIMYKTAIRNGGDAEWNLLWDYYKVTDEHSKIVVLGGFSGTKNKTKLNDFLELLFKREASEGDLKITKLVAYLSFKTAFDSGLGFSPARDYFYDNFNKIYDFFEDKTTFCEMLPDLFERMKTEEERSKAEEFMKAHKDAFAKCPETSESYLQKIQINIDWVNNRLTDFEKYLNEKYPD